MIITRMVIAIKAEIEIVTEVSRETSGDFVTF